MNDPSYGPFSKTLGSILDGVHLFHLTPTPFPPTVLSTAPVVEILSFFNQGPEFLSNMQKFVELAESKRQEGLVPGLYGGAYGESVEVGQIKHAEVLEGKEAGGEGKAVVGWLGWESVEAHMAFRETDPFKESIGLLRGGKSGPEVFHVKFTAV